MRHSAIQTAPILTQLQDWLACVRHAHAVRRRLQMVDLCSRAALSSNSPWHFSGHVPCTGGNEASMTCCSASQSCSCWSRCASAPNASRSWTVRAAAVTCRCSCPCVHLSARACLLQLELRRCLFIHSPVRTYVCVHPATPFMAPRA
jgi:hypothetical protein